MLGAVDDESFEDQAVRVERNQADGREIRRVGPGRVSDAVSGDRRRHGRADDVGGGAGGGEADDKQQEDAWKWNHDAPPASDASNCYCLDEDFVQAGGDSIHEHGRGATGCSSWRTTWSF